MRRSSSKGQTSLKHVVQRESSQPGGMEYQLTIRQKEILDQFKERVVDIHQNEWDEHYLTKWLIARNFDLNKAEDMLRNSMRYREKMKVNSILEEYEVPEVLKKYLVGGMCGYDKDGSPVRVEPFGNLDMKGIMKSVKKSDLEKVAIRNCEELVQECRVQTKLKGRRVDGFTLIFDMSNFSRKMLWKPGLTTYMHNAEILQNNYPEMQKRMFIINAPKMLPFLWKMAQPLISVESRNKIKVLGKNYKEELLKYVDQDQLPAYLGGTMTGENGDPMVSNKICHGGDVPESYYVDEASTTKTMESVTVSPGNELKIECEVDSPGSVLTWNFKTENRDIGFGVHLHGEDGREKELIPKQRVDSHIMEQDGCISCDTSGKYYLIFDNSYSWAATKKLFYLIDIYALDSDLEKEIKHMSLGSKNGLANADESTQM